MSIAGTVFRARGLEGYEWVMPVHDRDFEKLRFDGSRLGDRWDAVEMKLITQDVQPRTSPWQHSDFPWFGGGLLVLRPSALDAVRDILAPYGEFLPLLCAETPLWAFNVTELLDCLDQQASRIVRFRNGEIMRIEHAVFHFEQIRAVTAFKVPDARYGPIFFGQELVDLVSGRSSRTGPCASLIE